MDNAEREQFRADIRSHLQANGSRNWGALRERYSTVPSATWWRSIAREKARVGTQHLAFHNEQNLAGHTVRAPNWNAKVAEAATLPPGLAGGGFNFLAAFHGLFADAIKLRQHALRPDGNVRNPALLDRSIRTRLKLVSQGLELERQIYSARAQRAFYDALVEEIATESPALQSRIISRLRSFNRRFETRELSEARSEKDAGK